MVRFCFLQTRTIQRPEPSEEAKVFLGFIGSWKMTTPYNIMDPRYTRETSEHLEKQNELLWDAYRSMTHELHKLQVEEEMLMRKFFEVMSAHGLTKKKEDVNDILDDLMERKNDTLEGNKQEKSRGSIDETSDEEQ